MAGHRNTSLISLEPITTISVAGNAAPPPPVRTIVKSCVCSLTRTLKNSACSRKNPASMTRKRANMLYPLLLPQRPSTIRLSRPSVSWNHQPRRSRRSVFRTQRAPAWRKKCGTDSHQWPAGGREDGIGGDARA